MSRKSQYFAGLRAYKEITHCLDDINRVTSIIESQLTCLTDEKSAQEIVDRSNAASKALSDQAKIIGNRFKLQIDVNGKNL